MRYNILGYLIGEGFGNVLKNKKSTAASLMIMCATMIIFGVFWILGENINSFMEELKDEQGIEVFMNKDASEEEINSLKQKLEDLNEFSEITYISEDEAFKRMKERNEDNPNILAGYTEENHVFSASYILKFNDLSKSSELETKIAEYEEVKNIMSADATTERLMQLADGIKIFTGIISVLLVVISIFIISNTIKLTVHARRKEISIMKYVGATNNFIRWPFIVEGMLIGFFANIISITALGITYNYLIPKIGGSEIMTIINMELLTFGQIFNGGIITLFMIFGLGIGAIGSIISMRKYLKV